MDARELLGGDTIVALATPPGESGIGVVRLSGKDSFLIAKKISRLKNNKRFPEDASHVLMLCRIQDPNLGSAVDEVFVAPMKSPHTYTGEDVVEFHAHGSPVALCKIVQLCLKQGARLARPGEFTKRAFLSGRMDLTQAEAVLDIIQAKNEKSLSVAVSCLAGGLKEKILSLKERLVSLLARVEVIFDYPEEGLEEISPEKFAREIEEITAEINKLCGTYDEGKRIKEGIKTVFAGKPNAGKSSLLNALVQRDRAIVTDIPGTTRDTLEAGVHLQGVPVTFVDTAGLRQETADVVEQMGMNRTKDALKDAGLVLAVFDVSLPFSRDDESVVRELSGRQIIAVLNKCDLEKKLDVKKIKGLVNGASFVETSAVTGEGLEELKEKMIVLAADAAEHLSDEDIVLTHLRHKHALVKASEFLAQALTNAKNKMPMDLLTVDMRASLAALDEITGEAVSGDLLSEIFSRFCVGK